MSGPLSGIKVIDLTRAMAGPFASMMLADFGAEVIKVEPMEGDESRSWGPPFVGGESAYFLSANRNKKSLCINLRLQKGQEIIKKLVSSADVFIENFRPGTTQKMGLSYTDLLKFNPKIVYCSISGFGQTGPWNSKPGYDLIALAESGMMGLTGESGGEPVKFGVPAADIASGMFAAFSITSALFRRQINGLGEYIDVSLFDSMLYWLTHQGQAFLSAGYKPVRMGSSHPNIVPYRAYKASDNYLVVCVGNDSLWAKLCSAMNLNELVKNEKFATNAARVRNREELDSILSGVFAQKPVDHWLTVLGELGVPCAQVKDLAGALKNPHVLSRGLIKWVKHKKVGTLETVFATPHLLNSRSELKLPPPTLGEHTKEILYSEGYTEREVMDLEKEGVIRSSA
jgi:crotonobetainyl-CoA:carnitine CoA-transferase CaiB-like acyl-CoA transferase